MLLEEVKGLTRLNVLLDGKIRQGILEVNESRLDDELGVRISRLREMKREERASADSIAKMIKKLKTGKTL
jgi:phage-related minor tail protein